MEASVASSAPTRVTRRPARLLRLAGDERLVADVRTGSETAFEVLYDRHHRGILGFCRHMLGSYEEAEDAVQHTFMAAYRDLVSSEKPIQLKAWLYTIARNRCLSVLRARRERPSDDIEEVSTVGLAAEVEQREDLRLLLHDVSELPEDQRAALVLAEVGDVSHDEIAEVLGVPKQKVKALVFQARSSLSASRNARETPCEEIREELANLHGGSLRRTHLRRHLRECAGCRVFRAEMDTQRRGLAMVLPVIPALGLKEHVLAAVFGGGSAGGGAVVAGGAGAGAGAFAAKALIVLAVVGGGTAGVATVAGGRDDAPALPDAVQQVKEAGSGGSVGGGGAPPPAVVGPVTIGGAGHEVKDVQGAERKPARRGTTSGGRDGLGRRTHRRPGAAGTPDGHKGHGAKDGVQGDSPNEPKKSKKDKKPKKDRKPKKDEKDKTTTGKKGPSGGARHDKPKHSHPDPPRKPKVEKPAEPKDETIVPKVTPSPTPSIPDEVQKEGDHKGDRHLPDDVG
jgi:RNA polymerase sigma factor (sigma-70 family)